VKREVKMQELQLLRVCASPAEGSSDTLCPAESPTEMRSPIDTLRVRPLGALMDCPSSSYSSPASIRGLAVSGRPVACMARGVSCTQVMGVEGDETGAQGCGDVRELGSFAKDVY